MRTLSITLFASLTLLFSSCMKHASDFIPEYGTDPNTWSFSDGTKDYLGVFYTNPVLTTTAQSNGTYLLNMTGREKGAGQLLTMAIALSDLDLTPKTYQSGINGSDHSTAFYFTGSAGSRDGIYSSTNTDPGAVITYNVVSYNPDKNVVRISFSGEVFDANGKLVKISNGKLAANIKLK
jgi:hypothetical protein